MTWPAAAADPKITSVQITLPACSPDWAGTATMTAVVDTSTPTVARAASRDRP